MLPEPSDDRGQTNDPRFRNPSRRLQPRGSIKAPSVGTAGGRGCILSWRPPTDTSRATLRLGLI